MIPQQDSERPNTEFTQLRYSSVTPSQFCFLYGLLGFVKETQLFFKY